MSIKLTRAVRASGGIEPTIKRRCANSIADKLAALPSGTVIRRVELRRYSGSARDIDGLIRELKKARTVLGGDAKWWGWDDESLILVTRTGVAGDGAIIPIK